MAEVSFEQWKTFLSKCENLHILQTAEWGELKAGFGWNPVRLVSGNCGVQILFRKLPLGFTLGYLAKPVNSEKLLANGNFLAEIDSVCRKKRAIFLKIEPDLWESAPFAIPPSLITSR